MFLCGGVRTVSAKLHALKLYKRFLASPGFEHCVRLPKSLLGDVKTIVASVCAYIDERRTIGDRDECETMLHVRTLDKPEIKGQSMATARHTTGGWMQ